ncbi:TetR/AcrR family transcriptional regulator [Aquamicrobium sp. NLF2-7]|uniref:TetR/AcrR family transcriptional regulator n=1 Tax=Aquamicrobium sp. NLF2-7 TaxID=2918753 RepID=UPI001EFBA0B4|nr:TetR/AcrR family transcriptional regulator [Aquamicrobium sp. NLF2-7]MCG8273218.1 TetR/AcrR family transcriptional regulator [Aquamicrobium sp. NLF2-7]
MARTRAADFEDKQRAILKSAAAVFAKQGMDKASMSMIASHSGVSKALLYHYYSGKDALIFDIVRTHLTELDEAIETADRPAEQPETRLNLLIRAALHNYEDADHEHKVQINGTDTLSAEQMNELRAIERRIVRRFSGLLKEINPGIDENRPYLMPVTMSLFGMLNWVYMWFRPGGPVNREEYADLATRLILEGVKAVR